MKRLKSILLITVCFLITACNAKMDVNQKRNTSIVGTWRLISATSTENGITTSTFNPKNKMIKIINDTHFSFFNHDLQNGKDTNPSFTAGAGRYSLKDSIYTEHLDYFIHRDWENNTFEFEVKIKNDTLTQKGIEKVAKLGVDHIIIEKYVREQ